MYRAGMCSILSQLVREGRLSVVDNLIIDAPKTKQLAQKLKGLGMDNVLIITGQVDENLFLSARNLPNVLVLEVGHADPVNLVRYARVLMTRDAVKKMEEVMV